MTDVASLRREFEARTEDAVASVRMIDDVLSGRQELPIDLSAKDVCEGWIVNLRKRLADLQAIAEQLESVVDQQ